MRGEGPEPARPLPRRVRANPMKKTTKRARPRGRTAALVLLAAGIAGCASVETKKPGPQEGFFPPPPDEPRLQFLMAVTSDKDVPGLRKGLTAALLGDAPTRQLVRPRGVGVHDGVIYVADGRLGAIVRIDLPGKRFDLFAEGLGNPLGLDIDDEGRLFVADAGRSQVVAYDTETGAVLKGYGNPDELRPTDVAVLGDRLYVTDAKDHEIEVFDKETGRKVGTLGGEGAEPGKFKYPVAIYAAPDGNLYVTDSMNFRVQKLTPEGEPLASFGKLGDWTGSFTRPKGVAVDEEGLVHVLDAGFENAQIFLPDGQPATFYGGYGNFAGHMYLPFEITIDRSLLGYFKHRISPKLKPKYLVLVTNQSGPHKLNIYVFGDPAGEGAGREGKGS
ncbi:MAG: hypothetical protein D6718_09720 [Acidobacteria bacterium]|nr:MAG: hypothetical protein D6718_09720 [Acidobacteriota bacterium]